MPLYSYSLDWYDNLNILLQITSSITYVKAKCLASMKKDKYEVYVCLQIGEECKIEYAFCQCPIGYVGRV